MKRSIFILLLFIILPFFSDGQISYDHDIKLPDTIFGSSNPRDIVYMDNLIFVYTYNSILIFNESKEFQGKVEMGNLGRFTMRFNLTGWYVPDVKMMAADPQAHKLFFVTPSLKVQSIITSPLDTVPVTEIDSPTALLLKNLHGYTKLHFDERTDRIYWLAGVQSDNFHSWNSFFGVYSKETGEYDSLYTEFIDGSDPAFGYFEVVQTFEINPQNDDFYLSRKLKIDAMTVENDNTIALKKRIPTTTPRNAKMLLINDGSIKYLLAFPAYLPSDNYFETPDTLLIYQINTVNLDDVKTIDSPNKMITDAIYLQDKNHIVTCFVNDINFYQHDAPDKDVAVYSYSNGIFSFHHAINTNSATEVDTSAFNLNTTFKLVEKSDGKLFLSKKNEIIEITPTSTGSYTFTSKYYAKDSYFGNAVQATTKAFVINNVSSGLEFFNAIGHGRLETGYPAFNIVHNPINRKLYFFNRLSTENTGFYVFDLDSEEVEVFVETPRAIGDLVYNPVQNHILVSEFSKNTNALEGVRVYEGDNGTFVQTLSFTNTDYLGRMFVAPNAKIYISANMKTDNRAPQLLILDASGYSTLATRNVGQSEDPTQCYNLRSHFCYNPYNEKVYASFAPYVHKQSPYQTAYNGSSQILSDVTVPTGSSDGRLLSIDSQNNVYVINTTVENIGELICTMPDSVGEKSSYQGSIFVNGTHLHILDCKINTLSYINGITQIVDMDYSPRTNCLYAYHHYHYTQPGLDTNKITVFKIKEDGSFNIIWEKDGFGASITYNKYDDQLYFYYRTDKRMLGGNPAKVYTLNTYADTIEQTVSVALPTYSFMPEMVPQTNNAFFDPYGKAYFPNGMHSSVSVVNFTGGNEPLHLTPGPNWISIPRLEANDGTNFMQADTIPDVFNRDRFAIPYSTLALEHNRVWSSSSEQDYLADWKEGEWTFDPNNPDNQNNFSYRGYTLELEPNGNNTLYMHGQIKDKATTFPLYKDKKNWIGYFLVQEQDVFDALADHIDSITEIWHRNYYCYRPNGNDIIFGPEGGGVSPPSGPEWACTNSGHRIKYGEMIKVHPISDFDGESAFYWSTGNNTPPNDPRQGASNYSYTETASYKPIVIELNSTENPEEIGAFVNDTCVGACSVIEADTAVILMAYLDGRPADSIEFREYSSAKSSGRNSITSYLVFNKKRGQFEKRGISTREGNERVLVSFKKHEAMKPEKPGLDFKLWPNPASDRLFYSFTLNKEIFVSISLFDIAGKLIAEPLHNAMQAGSTRGELLLKSFTGEKLKPGIYLVKIKAGGIIKTKKVIVN